MDAKIPPERWVVLLKALADPTRLRIVKAILDGQHTVNDIVERIHASQYNVSRHLRILRDAGLVNYNQKGLYHEYHIVADVRQRYSHIGNTLDLGCCHFHFDELP